MAIFSKLRLVLQKPWENFAQRYALKLGARKFGYCWVLEGFSKSFVKVIITLRCDPRTIRIYLGADELNLDDSTSVKKAGIVSGDRLFLEM